MEAIQTKTLAVIGGGAAGFFCAVNAARMAPSLKVIILEKTSKVLSKVKVSGGGRCNVTHDCNSIAEMVKQYPRGAAFLKKAFHHFFVKDTLAWFEERGVVCKTEADGRMFPTTDDSQTVIDCLMREVNRFGIEILFHREVNRLIPTEGKWSLQLGNGETMNVDLVCIATGGYPKPMQFDWLTKTGINIESPLPSLFTFNIPDNPITQLMGISVELAIVKVMGSKLVQQGPLLITHWGMSGPAILKLSAWGARELAEKQYEFTLLVNWLPAYNEQQLREKVLQVRLDLGAQKIGSRNPFGLPMRLWHFILQQCGIDEQTRWADLPAKNQQLLVRQLNAGEFSVKGKTTFKEEFVTAGGVQLSEIHHHSMESKQHPGLYFCGEVIDCDGVTGGYNFQNAWTTGYIAAQAIAAKD